VKIESFGPSHLFGNLGTDIMGEVIVAHDIIGKELSLGIR
jgi:hypothetical protein